MKQARTIYISIIFLMLSMIDPAAAWAPFNDEHITPDKSASEIGSIIPAYQLRPYAIHDAGRLYFPVDCSGIPTFRSWNSNFYDPETGEPGTYPRFPNGSNVCAFYGAALWLGGIVGEDTLVSVGFDGWFANICEFWPPDPEQGGLIRTGRFADDEFVADYTDTVTAPPYITESYPFDENRHTPMGLKVTQTSYSWRDTLYDDFVIINFTVENIGSELITDGWVGILFDPDLFADTGGDSWYGYRDDASGVLDTLLDINDPQSRTLIAYGFDRDGDPGANSTWASYSIRNVMSLSLLATSIENPEINFNWWMSNGNAAYDFGPRRLGTPEDSLRIFVPGVIGTPSKQEDKYYILSHYEVDYNTLEMMVHDSSDGWVPPAKLFGEYIHDAKMLYSFGPFDLSPGDSMTFAIVVCGSDNFHVEADDYARYFGPDSPYEYEARFDFSDLMTNHRRADSVYRSGFALPQPGPPVGLRIVDHDDDYVALVWNASLHPTIAGYHLNVKDTIYSDHWFHAFPEPVTDTSCVFPVANPTHPYLLAISTIDSSGNESALSRPVDIIPASPHVPCSLTVALDAHTAVLSWAPPDDEGLAAYLIYRAVWDSSFALYDSTMQIFYRDEACETGVRYSFRITARHECGAESEPSDTVSVLPMALDKGILFYDLNLDNFQYTGPYQKRFVDRLFYSLQPEVSPDYYDIDDGYLSFKDMADYTVIIFDCEKRGGRFPPEIIDSMANYLKYGGRALFIIPNTTTNTIGALPPRLTRFYDDRFFHDILHLDSAVINSIVLKDNAIWGDLTGCRPLMEGFPALEADTVKLEEALIDIAGYIPYAGAVYPDDGVDILYRYQSLYPDSLFHEQVNGIGYADENYSFVLFGFPLSLMSETSNILALRAALEYLGVFMDCGDVNDDNRLDIGDPVFLIDYLYRGGPPPAELRRADVNCDGDANLGDAVAIINLIFSDAPQLDCCE